MSLTSMIFIKYNIKLFCQENKTSISLLSTTTSYEIANSGQTSTLTIKSFTKKGNVYYTCAASNIAAMDGVEVRSNTLQLDFLDNKINCLFTYIRLEFNCKF